MLKQYINLLMPFLPSPAISPLPLQHPHALFWLADHEKCAVAGTFFVFGSLTKPDTKMCLCGCIFVSGCILFPPNTTNMSIWTHCWCLVVPPPPSQPQACDN